MNEQLIYEEGKIRITSNVFYNGSGDQFIIATIRDIAEGHKPKPLWALFIGLILLGLAGWQEFFMHSRMIFGGIGAICLLWYLTSKERHSIRLITPAGEGEAFVTKDENQHKTVLSCLKRAWHLHK